MLSLLTKGNLIRYQIVLVSGDVFIALGLFLFVHNSLPLPFNGLEWGGIITPSLLMISYLCGRYQASTTSRLKVLYFSIIVGLIGVFFFLTGSVVIIGSLSAFLVIQNEWHKIVHKIYDAMLLQQKFLILGTGPLAEKAERLINDESDQYSLLGFIGTPKDYLTVPQDKILGTIEDVVEITKRFEAQSIIIALTEKRGNPFMDQLVTCKLNGVRIIDYPVFSEMMTGKIPIEDINPSWLVQSNGFFITPLLRRIKRCLDIFAAILLLIFTFPLFPVVYLIIKRVSPGPIIYEQERVGLHGTPFTIYKFRSMNVDAEKATGPVMNSSIKDDRIYPFGAFMRKTRIDELPQLINVLKGDMSFIGPRPERPEFVEQINKVDMDNIKFYNERHAVKPGITGWAQVMFRYGSDIGDSIEKLRYDLYYINNMSLILDLLIVLETIKVVLFRRGSM